MKSLHFFCIHDVVVVVVGFGFRGLWFLFLFLSSPSPGKEESLVNDNPFPCWMIYKYHLNQFSQTSLPGEHLAYILWARELGLSEGRSLSQHHSANGRTSTLPKPTVAFGSQE